MCVIVVFFFKQKTAYEMRISDWSSDVCSSDLRKIGRHRVERGALVGNVIRALGQPGERAGRDRERRPADIDRKSVVSGKSVSVRVDLGGRRIIQKKKTSSTSNQTLKDSARPPAPHPSSQPHATPSQTHK